MTKKKNENKHPPKKVLKNLIFMLKFSAKYTPKYLWITIFDSILRAASTVSSVLLTKYIFDAIEGEQDFLRILVTVLIVGGAQAAIELFFLWRYEVYRPVAELAIHEGMQKEFYAKARSLDQSCYDDPEFYNDFIWAIRESDGRVGWIVLNLNVIPIRVISLISIFGILAYLDVYLAIFFLVSSAVGMYIKFAINRRELDKKNDLNHYDRALSYIHRTFYMPDKAKELRQGEIANLFRKELNEINEEKTECKKKHGKRLLGISTASAILTNTLPNAGATAYLIIRYILDSSMSLGTFSASIQASLRLYWTMNELVSFITVMNEHSLYVEKVRKFLEYEPTVLGEEKDVPSFETLELRGVSFAYPFSGESKNTLSDISFEIKKGEKIAFVGYNGAGKTTLTKLLMRLYDPSEGEILYNGNKTTVYSPEEYRQHIGAVFQDYKIFSATLAENVVGGEYDDSMEERVRSALSAASFDEKLAALPKGIHTQLTTEFSEDGVGLSGGESQKVAIARAFAGDFDIMILDEPSSALDPIAEYEINRSILKNACDKTVIFISHRLSTTRMADRIYMFEKGRIIESGSHEELMALDGKYAEMYRVQAKKYKIE